MDLPGSSYFLGLATICITFVSVSTVAFIFREAIRPSLSRVEIVLIRSFIRVGLVATIFSLLPLLLNLLGILPSVVWRASSAALAVLHLVGGIQFNRSRADLVPLSTPAVYYTLFVVSVGVIAGLVVNAIGISVEPGPGLYALGVTWVLAESMVMFIIALRVFLEPLEKTE